MLQPAAVAAAPPAVAAPVLRSAWRARLAASVAIGLLTAVLAGVASYRKPNDFAFPWRGAQLLLDGQNPYRVLTGGLPAPFEEPLYYPLTSLLIAAPVAALALWAAAAVAVGASCGWLAWLLTRDGAWWRLWLFASAPAVVAVHVGQWSPLLVAASFLPAAGFLFLAKPNIGLALYLARPTWRATVGCVALLVVSLAVNPAWPLEWRASLAALTAHPAPILTPWGVPALLALLRWRRPEARLIVAMACVPQLLFFADQLPLWLVPRTRREMVALSACSLAAFGAWFIVARSLHPELPYVPQAAPWVLAGCYLPALAMVLRRPNVGDIGTPLQ